MAKSPVRILHVVGRMNRGGAESFIMNVYRNINRDRVQFDFAVNTNEKSHFDEEILSLGGRIFSHPSPSGSGISAYSRLFSATLSNQGPFAGVHSHVHHFSGVVLKAAAQAGIKLRIAHSHSTSDGRQDSFSRRIYHWYMKRLLKCNATNLFFCSNEAGLSLFGNNIFADPRAQLVRNVIEPTKYANNVSLFRIREQLHIDRYSILIGHVGRFDEVKNHRFMLMVFAHFLTAKPCSFLLLIGDGPLRAEMELLAQQLNIASRVLFLGIRSDVHELLQCMDFFFFPSLYEGQPLALVEAQVAGLPCVVSDTISIEADINVGLVTALSLQTSEQKWVEAMQAALTKTIPDFTKRYESLCSAGFDLQKVVQSLEDIYCENN